MTGTHTGCRSGLTHPPGPAVPPSPLCGGLTDEQTPRLSGYRACQDGSFSKSGTLSVDDGTSAPKGPAWPREQPAARGLGGSDIQVTAALAGPVVTMSPRALEGTAGLLCFLQCVGNDVIPGRRLYPRNLTVPPRSASVTDFPRVDVFFLSFS